LLPHAPHPPTQQTCAQVLLTLENLADRSQYVNARNTFTELLAYNTIPVVNENVSKGLGE
jgi:glutamate 5-kinase